MCSTLDGVRWVLFDAVGTLIFPDPPVAEVYLAVGERFGSRLSIDEIRRRFPIALERGFTGGCETSEANERRRWRSIVGEVISDVPERADSILEELWEHFAQPGHWRVYDDVGPALDQLRERGFEVGIASNFDGRLKGIVSGHRALAGCAEVFVSSNVGYCKPDGLFFEAVQRRLGVEAREIALVGDDEVCDVEGAMAAGWRAVYLDRDGAREGGIRSLAELV